MDTTMTLTMTLEDAKEQLQDRTDRVQQIRAKLAEMRTIAMGSTRAHARNEAALAEAVLAGGDIGAVLESMPAAEQGITPAPVTPSEARRIVSGLEALLAEALDHENQAKSTVRRAAIGDLKALLEAEKKVYDAAAQALMHQWARTTELMARVAGVTGMQQHSMAWASMRLPRAIPPKHIPAFTTGEVWCHGSEEIQAGGIGNRARAEIAELLKQKGIDQ